MRFPLLPLFLAFPLVLGAETPVYRSWTDDSNRTVEAAFQGREGDRVKLLLRNGNTALFPLSRLSQADQDFVKSAKTPESEASAGGATASTGGKMDWPVSVDGGDKIIVTTVKEDKDGRDFIYQTQNFEFRSQAQLGTNVIKEFGRLFEAVNGAVAALPLQFAPAPPDGHFIVMLYETMGDYTAAGGLSGSAGCYDPNDKRVMVPLESLGVKKVGNRYSVENRDDNHTLIHEITHQMLHDWGRVIPVWLNEGMAEFMSGAKYRTGRFSFAGHAGNIKDYVRTNKGVFEKSYNALALDKLMTMSHSEWNGLVGKNTGSLNTYVTAVLLAYYFAHVDEGDGIHLKEYLVAVKGGTDEKEAREKFLLRGRKYEEVEKELANTWRREGITLNFVGGGAGSASK